MSKWEFYYRSMGWNCLQLQLKGSFCRRTFNYTIPVWLYGSGPDGGGPVVTADYESGCVVTRGQENVNWMPIEVANSVRNKLFKLYRGYLKIQMPLFLLA